MYISISWFASVVSPFLVHVESIFVLCSDLYDVHVVWWKLVVVVVCSSPLGDTRKCDRMMSSVLFLGCFVLFFFPFLLNLDGEAFNLSLVRYGGSQWEPYQ